MLQTFNKESCLGIILKSSTSPFFLKKKISLIDDHEAMEIHTSFQRDFIPPLKLIHLKHMHMFQLGQSQFHFDSEGALSSTRD